MKNTEDLNGLYYLVGKAQEVYRESGGHNLIFRAEAAPNLVHITIEKVQHRSKLLLAYNELCIKLLAESKVRNYTIIIDSQILTVSLEW